MSKDSGQKFLRRNRPPRVQIEYDVETGGAQKKVSLPFIMGVMSDLAGQQELPPVEERKFLEYDGENINDRMAAINPEVSFRVPNTMTNKGELSVKLGFKHMDDFDPERVAEQVEPLNQMLQARKQLDNLLARMDGKADAEQLLNDMLSNSEFLQKLAEKVNANASTETEEEAET